MSEFTIREADVRDSSAIAHLLVQLGYPTTSAQMAGRIKPLLSRPEYQMYVAVGREGRVVGMVGAYLGHALEFDGPYGRVNGLAVDEGSRRHGIGRHLMEHIENWLRTQGAVMLVLTSGQHRVEAHKFYRAIGYEQTGVRFVKRL